MMRILFATDAFPPVCGGSGWSTYELARGLRARGHEVFIVHAHAGSPAEHGRSYDGFRVRAIEQRAPSAPFVRNYFKNERLWARAALELRAVAGEVGADLIHAQHVLTSPAAVAAGASSGVPVVCTVRDYWPVCYWGTLIHDPASPTLCPACSASMMTRCIRPRAGAAWPLALPFIPYMRGNLARKQHALAGASAVVAVSSAIARDLRQRSSLLAPARIEIIPNPVDVAAIRRAAQAEAPPVKGPYAIFVGKLEQNKGTQFLLPALERAGLSWPLVVVGDGRQRGALEADARRLNRDVRFLGWLDRPRVMAWLAHASLLVFPSYGPESLSRVLLEAAAIGIPIAAMHTGGTGDIIAHGVSGLLSATPEELGEHVARLAADRALAEGLARRAREHVDAHFDTALVVGRVEALYRELMDGRPRHA
ncbi:MAG: glycosyltransferase family 4 protein [Vicinamibacterales bacterium]|jgi:glycosyltransferase involved in cell wall biosynthesis|nr:glycosyltransferase family 4 protein [Vicinamibacterales bacterium]